MGLPSAGLSNADESPRPLMQQSRLGYSLDQENSTAGSRAIIPPTRMDEYDLRIVEKALRAPADRLRERCGRVADRVRQDRERTSLSRQS